MPPSPLPDPSDTPSAPVESEGSDLRIGGQAVIEGVMMRGRKHWSMAVRKPDGTIYRQIEPLDSFLVRHPSWDKPFLRGVFVLVESLILGWKALTISADIALEEEEGGEGLGWLMKALTFIVAIGLAVFLFIFVPTWLAPLIVGDNSPVWLWNLVEGGMRLAFFILYIVSISLISEMRRIFQYHGAEHQSIHLLEHNYPLEPEFALREGTDHLRCGTSFILLVLVLTIVVYSFLGKPAVWIRVLERIALIPLIAALAYEIMKWADRSSSPWKDFIVAPGLALQSLTTRKPDRDQSEVALEALKSLLEKEDLRQQG